MADKKSGDHLSKFKAMEEVNHFSLRLIWATGISL